MKKVPDEYRGNPHSVTLINYHFVFCPKRRKKVLTGKISHRLQEIINDLCTENNWRLIALEIMPDHVHLFLNTDPTFAPSVIVKRIKGRSPLITLEKNFLNYSNYLRCGLPVISLRQLGMLRLKRLEDILRIKKVNKIQGVKTPVSLPCQSLKRTG